MINTSSDLWLEIEAWAKGELLELTKQLKNPRTTHDESQVLRGSILKLEELLALPEPKKKPKVQAAASYGA